MYRRPYSKPGIIIYNSISKRKHISTIARLRTGHCYLNRHMHRIRKAESAHCQCGESYETVAHFLLKCELYERERDVLRRNVGVQGMRLEILLGDPEIVQHTLHFTRETGRFLKQ